jgi:hypothetical protein
MDVLLIVPCIESSDSTFVDCFNMFVPCLVISTNQAG